MSKKSNDSGSSDDEPLEISDFSVCGPFEQSVSKLAQFLRGAVKEFHMECDKLLHDHKAAEEVKIENTGYFFARELHFSVPTSLQGLDDFETRLNGTSASPISSSPASSHTSQQKLVATLQILRPDGAGTRATNLTLQQQQPQKQKQQQASSAAASATTNTTAASPPLPEVYNRHPIVGLCGLAAFLYLRPLDRTPHLGHQMSSTLLSLGLNAIDEAGPSSLVNVVVVAPSAGSKHSMTFRGTGKFRVFASDLQSASAAAAGASAGGGDELSQSNLAGNLLFPPTAIGKMLASPYLYRTNDNLSSVIPLVLPASYPHNSSSSSMSKEGDQPYLAALDISSRSVPLKERAFAGLGFLDGIVDAFVQSCGRQSRFVRVKAADIGMLAAADAASGASSRGSVQSGKSSMGGGIGGKKGTSASFAAAGAGGGKNSDQLEGTLWADASRVYRSPVPSRSRWLNAMLPSWDSQPNGHDRAMAGVFLGFDSSREDANEREPINNNRTINTNVSNNNSSVLWTQLAGMPSLPIGTTENPLETFSVECSWNSLRVDATSVTDNESVSWFEDVLQSLFSAQARSAEAAAAAAASGGGGSNAASAPASATARKNLFGFASRSTARAADAAPFFSGAASSAAAAALGPPTGVALAAHMRHRAEFSSRIKPALQEFVSDVALKVLAGPLNDARRRFIVEQSASRVGDAAVAVRSAFLRRGKQMLSFGSNKAAPASPSASDAAVAASSPQLHQQQPVVVEEELGVRAAVKSWFGALVAVGATAVNAVTHSAFDAVRGAHPEELIVPRRSMLAAHINNILAALRTPDSGLHSVVISLPRTTAFGGKQPQRKNGGGKQQQQQQQAKKKKAAGTSTSPSSVDTGKFIPLFHSLRPDDIRRQVPPGSVLSRFAIECRQLKHLDEMRELFVTLVDVLREILTGGRADEMGEEYHFVSALQVAKSCGTNRKESAEDGGGGGVVGQSAAAAKKQSEQRIHRVNILLASLLVDVDGVVADNSNGDDDYFSTDTGMMQVDCCADIVHQKLQALAICAIAVRNAEQRKWHASNVQDGEEEEEEEDEDRKCEALPSAKKLAETKLAKKLAKTEPGTKSHQQQQQQRQVKPEDVIYAPSTAGRFSVPITFGDRNTTAVATGGGGTATAASANGTRGGSSIGSGAGAGAAAAAQASEMLYHDMADFLRVNRKRRGSAVCLADFLAWFSPNDVADFAHESEELERVSLREVRAEEEHAARQGSLPLGYEFLSLRMRQKGNAWREAWLAASKVDAAANSAARAAAAAAASVSSHQNNNGNNSSSGNKRRTSIGGSDQQPAVDEGSQPLQAALEILDWLKQRPSHEIAYVVLKAQAAAAAAQLVQHPVFHSLDEASATSDHLRNALQNAASRTAQQLSSSFPSWEDFEEELVIEVQTAAPSSSLSSAGGRKTSGSTCTKPVPTFGDDDDMIDCAETDGGASSLNAEESSPARPRYQQQQPKSSAATASPSSASSSSPSPPMSPPLDTVGPEVAHKLGKLFEPHILEMEKAEYLLCVAVSVCDAVSPFGNGADSAGLLQTAQRVCLAVFDFVSYTDSRFTTAGAAGSDSSSSAATAALSPSSLHHHEVPVDWESAIYTADASGRIAPPVYVDSGLFFRAMSAAWLSQDRGVDSSTSTYASTSSASTSGSSSSSKVRRVLAKRYRVYGYTQRLKPQLPSSIDDAEGEEQQQGKKAPASSATACSSWKKNRQGNDDSSSTLLPASFQRVVAHVDCSTKTVLMVSTSSKVI